MSATERGAKQRLVPVYLEEERHAEVKAAADRAGVTMSAVIKMRLAEWEEWQARGARRIVWPEEAPEVGVEEEGT